MALMRVEYTTATGCPYGQFVIMADNEQDRAILDNFIKAGYSGEWEFWRHGASYRCGENGAYAFNFGYIKKRRPTSHCTGRATVGFIMGSMLAGLVAIVAHFAHTARR